MEIGEANRGEDVWFVCMDEMYPFARQAEVVGQAAMNTQSCIIKVSSYQEGVDNNGKPIPQRIMIPWMLLFRSKDEAIQNYVQRIEEQLIRETRRWEQTELQEKENICKQTSKKNSFSLRNTEADCMEQTVQAVTET